MADEEDTTNTDGSASRGIESGSFELNTARTLGRIEKTVEFHQQEIVEIKAGVGKLNDRFDHVDSDLHLMKESIDKLQNPKIDEKKLKKDLRRFFAWLILIVATASGLITWAVEHWAHFP
jgi:hypothetical protein